ncbi:hypothetical protein K7711_08825 [Nocardia sp. CA2R105]|uniref:hypothetical protein n=1 Tax=Nocardia coffeae TaxID=2873381 RepID=UPI001CA615EB|nr:hypothetical protein [Nocardia coffeae]MBY8856577.1 hypothetical protein [Nocardia coffeae]
MPHPWIFAPAGSDLDRAEQDILLRERERDAGLDISTLTPPPDTVRAALDPADLADRIDQAWITPLDCDDDYDHDTAD